MARLRWVVALVLILGGSLFVAVANADDAKPVVQVGLESLSLVSATTEKVQLRASISLASS